MIRNEAVVCSKQLLKYSKDTSAKMLEAEELIKSTDLYVSEIAYKLGYKDPKYFSKCFKKFYHFSPREYKALLNNEGTVADNYFLELTRDRIEKGWEDTGNLARRFASEMNVSVSTLWRRFKRNTGHSPVKFIRKIRLDKARNLLASNCDSIADIAIATGFSDTKYFCRCFKEEYGQTPSEFRCREFAIRR
ncbi:MAG TPA: AraC family transcriptional regulator [Paludibacter sp.]|nr:AraC family transcriptional regulator [Paludibacter sp.]